MLGCGVGGRRRGVNRRKVSGGFRSLSWMESNREWVTYRERSITQLLVGCVHVDQFVTDVNDGVLVAN
jgi:hypothetical protein